VGEAAWECFSPRAHSEDGLGGGEGEGESGQGGIS
jgi:hypothetical protein